MFRGSRNKRLWRNRGTRAAGRGTGAERRGISRGTPSGTGRSRGAEQTGAYAYLSTIISGGPSSPYSSRTSRSQYRTLPFAHCSSSMSPARPVGLPSYRSFSCGHGAPSSACSGLYIDVDAARSAVLLCRTQTNTHTTETEQTNMNKQPERHSGIAHQRRIKLASRKNSAHCACLFASWE